MPIVLFKGKLARQNPLKEVLKLPEGAKEYRIIIIQHREYKRVPIIETPAGIRYLRRGDLPERGSRTFNALVAEEKYRLISKKTFTGKKLERKAVQESRLLKAVEIPYSGFGYVKTEKGFRFISEEESVLRSSL